jgi:hypothetical protein
VPQRRYQEADQTVPGPKKKTGDRRFQRPAPQRPAAPATDAPAPYVRPVTHINTDALVRRTDLAIGDRVMIEGTGLYAGETAVIERLSAAMIPSAVVRTEAGRTRTVRLVDLLAY